MTTTTNYYEAVRAYAENLNTSANEDWEEALLRGAPKPLTATAVREIAQWVETEAPGNWDDAPSAVLSQIARDLRAIVTDVGND